MSINTGDSVGEVVFGFIPQFFQSFVDTLSRVLMWSTYSLDDLLQLLTDNGYISQEVNDIIDGFLRNAAFGVVGRVFWDTPLIAIMFGSALIIYFIFQFATWILNIVT